MVERIGQVLNRVVSSSEEDTNRIRKGPVSSFNRFVLEGRLGSCGSYLISF